MLHINMDIPKSAIRKIKRRFSIFEMSLNGEIDSVKSRYKSITDIL